MEFKKELFGMHNKTEVYEYTLTNENGVSLGITSYGAIITKLIMPDKDGKFENITMNANTLDEMVEGRPFHGAIIGRVSGRIADATYVDGEETIKLDENEATNMLHGGFTGLDQHIWNVTVEESDEKIALVLDTVSPDGEGGFPGDLKVTVTYTLNEDNEVKLTYEASTNKRTLFNPTNHVYFNLNGDYHEPILNHKILVNSERFGVLDHENIPTGELRAVDGTDFDMRELTDLGKVLTSDDKQIADRNGLDHPFVLNKEDGQPAAILKESQSGRVIEMTTDTDAVVVYSHNSPEVPVTESEPELPIHGGITLETCSLPDAVNQEGFGSIWLEAGEEYTSETVFKLSVQ